MAPDRSHRAPAELAGLRQPDGSVVVPPAVAGEVLRALVFAITEQARSTGGQPTARTRQLLDELYRAARQHEQHDQAADDDQAATVPGGLSVREAAAAMGCSTRWVRHLLATGRLPGRRAGGTWIVHMDRPLPETEAS